MSKRINEFEDLIENSLDGYNIDINDKYYSEYLVSDLNIHTFVNKIGIDKHNLDIEIDEFIFIVENGKKDISVINQLKIHTKKGFQQSFFMYLIL